MSNPLDYNRWMKDALLEWELMGEPGMVGTERRVARVPLREGKSCAEQGVWRRRPCGRPPCRRVPLRKTQSCAGNGHYSYEEPRTDRDSHGHYRGRQTHAARSQFRQKSAAYPSSSTGYWASMYFGAWCLRTATLRIGGAGKYWQFGMAFGTLCIPLHRFASLCIGFLGCVFFSGVLALVQTGPATQNKTTNCAGRGVGWKGRRNRPKILGFMGPINRPCPEETALYRIKPDFWKIYFFGDCTRPLRGRGPENYDNDVSSTRMGVFAHGSAALGFVAHGVVDEDEGSHGFDDGDGSGKHAGIVASAAFEGGVMKFGIHGILFMHDRGDGLEGDAKVDGFAIGDAALDATGTVGGRADLAALHAERVVVLGAGQQNAAEAGADVKSFGGRKAEHGFAQVCFQSVEHRFAPSGRNATRDAFDDSADAVAGAAHFLDETDHFLCGNRIGTADNVGFDIPGLDCFGIHIGDEALDLFDVSEDFDPELFAENFFGDGAGGDATDGFAGAGTAAALPIADAELGSVGVVGVGRTELGGHFRIGLGTSILIFDPKTDGGAERLAFKRAGEDLDDVRFFARRDDFGLAGPPAVEVRLNVRFREFQARRAAIHNHTDAAAMGLAPRRDTEEMTKRICHLKRVREKRGLVKSVVGSAAKGFLDGAERGLVLGAMGKQA
ncbi:MAG: hypothetical protein JWR26_4144 [Pedosphaera sp.]|nr:hypothetical protein [Pedosphaera sp.]